MEVAPLTCMSCSPLFSDQCLVRQESSHGQSLAPRNCAYGRKDEGGGLLDGPDRPHAQLGWAKVEKRALPFHLGQEKKASFTPQVLLNSYIPLLPQRNVSC